jgi:hypothetical protein
MTVVGFDIPVLPTLDNIENLLQALFGREVTLKRMPPGQAVKKPYLIGKYLDAQDQLRAVVVVDRPIAFGFGGALSMIPIPVVKEALNEESLPENLYDNAYEVLNVMASLFNDHRQGALHVKLREVSEGGLVDDQVSKMLGQKKNRADASVELGGGYGQGEISVRVV